MGSDEFKRAEFHYGLILVRTRRFQAVMDRLGANRVSKPVGWALLYLMPVAAFFGFYLFLSEASILLSSRGSAVAEYVRSIGPLANLGLPGINPYLPLVDGWVALIIAMIIHEGAHGIVARSLGLPVKASGLLFFLFVPIGAFVDVDEKAMKEARASHSARVLAAGAGINLIVGILSLLLLISVVSSMSPAANGIPISQVFLPSPAAQAGLRPGDFILAVNGVPYTQANQISNSSWYHPGRSVNLTVWSRGESRTLPLLVGARPNATVLCSTPAAVGRVSACTLALVGYLGSVSGDNVTFSSSGPGSFNSTTCMIRVDSCGVGFTPSGGSGAHQNITGSFQGDTYNLLNSGEFVLQIQAVNSTGGAASSSGSGAIASGTAASLAKAQGWIGTESISLSSLKSLVTGYSSPIQNPWQYVCIPTLPLCQQRVPFSDQLNLFYSSPFGAATAPLANLAYWVFFLNFNLAIFNALPIYPLDGGQAFSVGVKALGKGRMSDATQMRITNFATLAVVALILGVVLTPYLYNLI